MSRQCVLSRALARRDQCGECLRRWNARKKGDIEREDVARYGTSSPSQGCWQGGYATQLQLQRMGAPFRLLHSKGCQSGLMSEGRLGRKQPTDNLPDRLFSGSCNANTLRVLRNGMDWPLRQVSQASLSASRAGMLLFLQDYHVTNQGARSN